MAGGPIEYRVSVDTSAATAALRAQADAQRAAEQTAQAAQVAALGLTEAERTAAAEVTRAATAERQRAEALGVSVSELRAIQAALVAKADAERAAAAAAAQSGAAAQAERQADAYARMTDSVTLSNAVGERAATTTGRNAAAMANLRSQLIDVGVMLQGGANPFTVLSTQGPQIAEALASMEGGIGGVVARLAALGPALGIVAAAVVALGGAWLYLSHELENAEAKAEAASAAATKAQKAHEAWAGQAEEVARAVRVASGAISEEEAAAEGQIATWRQSREEQRQLLAAKLAAAQAAERAGGATSAEIVAVREASAALDAYTARTSETADTIAMLAEKKRLDREASDAAAAGAKASAEAQREADREMRDAIRLLDEASRQIEEQTKARKLLLDVIASGNAVDRENRRWEEQRAAIEAAADATGDAIAAQQALNVALREHQEILDKLNRAPMDWLQKQADLGAATAQQYAAMSAGPADVAQISGSDVVSGAASTLAASDPFGIASAILLGFQMVGSLGSTDNALTQVTDAVTQAIQGLQAAPDAILTFTRTTLGSLIPMIIENAPAMVAGVVPALLQGVLASAPELVGAFVEGILLFTPQLVIALAEALTDPQLWIAAGKGFVQSLGDAFASFVQQIIDGIRSLLSIGGRDAGEPGAVRGALRDVRDWIGGIGSGRASGGRVRGEETAYLVHANEVNAGGYVVPASGMEPSTVRHGYQARMGGSVTINMGRGIVLGTVEDLARSMRLEQQRLALGGG